MVRQLRLPSSDGVYVSAVDPDSPADEAGITRGTIITRVIAGNQRFEIRNTEDFNRIEKNMRSGQEIALMVLQQRGGQYRSGFVPLTIP
jgi:S1-C subfamily serine protease